MLNPVSSHSKWIYWLTGTADKLLLSMSRTAFIYTHASVFACLWESGSGANNKNITETKPIKVNYVRQKLVFHRTDNTSNCCYLEQKFMDGQSEAQIRTAICNIHGLKVCFNCLDFGLFYSVAKISITMKVHIVWTVENIFQFKSQWT
jgi:hypothetical protein